MGKVAVVTGGANGIGRAIALRFLDDGARVVVADLNEENGRGLIAHAEAGGHGRVRFARTDVSSEADVAAALAYAVEEFGGLDILVNNAGIGGTYGPITGITVDDWDRTLGVLLRGVFLGMKHGARVMKAQGRGGNIISTASIAGFGAGAGASCYSAAKAAVINLTQSVAVELAPDRIRVNAVAPGVVMTELYHRGNPSAAERRALDIQPWPQAGMASDVAGVVSFLTSSDGAFITGETIVIDGGMLARGPALFGSGRRSIFLKSAGMDEGTTGRVSRAHRISESAEPTGKMGPSIE